MATKRKLSEYMDTLSLDDCPKTNSKKQKTMCSVHCQTEETIYTESDIKEMINNYIKHMDNDKYSKIIETTRWVESF